MGKPIKAVAEKLKTKLDKLKSTPGIIVSKSQGKIGKKVLFRFGQDKISYTKTRYFPSMKVDVVEEDFSVEILLDHQTLNLLSGQIQNPPRSAGRILDYFRGVEPKLNSIIIGGLQNKIDGRKLYITYDLFKTLVAINNEEGKEKVVRVRSRFAPFLKENYNLDSPEQNYNRDYSLLMSELMASDEFTQQDIIALTNHLEVGESNEVVIEKRINKQAEWLLGSIQTIIDEPQLNASLAKKFGSELFGFSKNTISGPEDLMEKILTKYGQNIIFGVPALLNVDGYVASSNGLPKSQFDLLLVNNLSDIEIVELKRPDEYLLEYDASRAKFFMSKSLGTAAAQCERYISAIYREQDKDLKIQGKSIREFLQSQLGGTITLSICRPKALVVIGTIQKLAKKYEELPVNVKSKVTKSSYEKNLDHAYKELKSTFRNIDITTYTELVESARLRLQLDSYLKTGK